MKVNVAVMFGGESVEHEVSVISAMQGIEALDKEKYNVIPIYISKNSEYYSAPELMSIEVYQDLDKLMDTYPQVYLYRKNERVYMDRLKHSIFGSKPQEIDVVVPIVHGTNGEDGALQGYLEMLRVPYSGSDVVASAVGQDKSMMKHVLENSDLPIVGWFWFYSHEFENEAIYVKQAHDLGYPLVIKPANLGSSIGISLVNNDQEFIEGVLEATQFDEKIVVEKCVENLKEVNVSVMGDPHHAEVSELEEVSKEDVILSFDDKYISSGGKKGGGKSEGMASASRIIPANISEQQTEKIKEYALKTFKVLGSSGICRIDFMIDDKSGAIYINEINSIPGSLAFYLWSPLDIDFSMLMDNLIKQAIDRQRRKERMTFSYSSNILSNFNKNSAKGGKIK